jgi:hypothetical protein
VSDAGGWIPNYVVAKKKQYDLLRLKNNEKEGKTVDKLPGMALLWMKRTQILKK